MFAEPTKVFPCDCMGEGIAVTKYHDEEDISEGEVAVGKLDVLDDVNESPYIQLSFWEFGHHRQGRWSLWQRLCMAYQIAFKNKGPWEDMVLMKASHARSFANHILYVITKGEREKKLGEPIVKDDLPVESEIDTNINRPPWPLVKDGDVLSPMKLKSVDNVLIEDIKFAGEAREQHEKQMDILCRDM